MEENKEKASSVSLAETYLRVIAKHSISLHLMSRDMNVAKINFQKLVELEGGKVRKDPDAMFLSEERLEKSLSEEKEKLSPEKKKKEEEQKEKKKSLIPEKIGKKIEGIKGKAVNIFDKLKVLFSPKNFMKVLGKIALPLLILTTLWEGLTGAWEAYQETGSIWEAFKGGIGQIVEFFTFGLIDKKMVSELFDNIADFFKPVVDAIKTFFGDIGKWVGDKFDAVVSLFQTKEKAPKTDTKTQSELAKQAAELKKEEDRRQKEAAEEARKVQEERAKSIKEKRNERIAQAKQQQAQQKSVSAAPAAPAPTPSKSSSAPPSKPTSVVSGGGKSGGGGASGDFSKNGNLATAKKGLNEAGITNNFAVNAALGNILKEVGKDAVPKTENLKAYGKTSNERIRKVFGSRASKFSDAELDKIKQNEVDFGEMVYGKDTKIGQQMGNSEVGDGYKYRGRGFIQITGKNLYAKYSKSTKIDLLNNPDLINTPEIAAKTMGIFLIDGVGIKKLNSFENQNEANRAVTQAIGGQGLDLSKGIGAEILGKVDKYSAEVGGVESSTSPSAAPSNAVLSGTGIPIRTGSGGFLTTTQQETKKEEKKEEPKGSGDDAVKYPPNAGQAKVTSMYGFRTQPAGPKKGEKIFHGGIDYAGVPKGTPIQLLASAKILLARDVNGYGNMIDALVNGEVLRFAHLDSIKVKQGDEIPAKTIIGTLGNTGIGTGPHLHFEHRSKSSFQDAEKATFDPLKTGAPNLIAIGDKPVEMKTSTSEGGLDSSGSKIAANSIDLSASQRQQQKPQTPIIVNAPTTNNTVIANNKNVNIQPKRNTAGALATAAT